MRTSDRIESSVAVLSSSSSTACARASSNRRQRRVEIPPRGGRRKRDGLVGARLGLGGEGSSLRRGEALGEVLLHGADAVEIRGRVEPQPAGRASRLEQAVAALPRAEELGAHPRAPAQLADSQQSGALAHRLTIQDLNRSLTSRVGFAYPSADNIYTGGIQMKKLDALAAILVLVGGLNWGLVAVAEFDLVAWICGGLDFGETNAASRVVYGLVGLAAVYGIGSLLTASRRSGMRAAPAGAR